MNLLASPLTFCLLFACLAPAVAQETDERSPEEISKQRYAEADTDSNGSISSEEFKKYAESKLPEFKWFEQLWDKLDADDDGMLTPKEFANRQQVAQQLIDEYEAEMEANRKPKEFADAFNERFADQTPIVGATIEDLTAFDENGNELDFADLRGKYLVINFGCLT